MKNRGLKKTLGLLLLLATGAMLLAGLAFALASRYANSVRLPERLRAPIKLDAVSSATAISSAPRFMPSPLGREELIKAKDYNDYLKLRLAKDPRLASVALYLQLCQRYESEEIKKSFAELGYRDDDGTTDFRLRLEAWQRNHEGFIAQTRRFAHAEPLPPITFDEQRKYYDAHHTFLTARMSLGNLIQMLGCRARISFRNQEAAEGYRCLEDGFRLIGKNRGGYGFFIGPVVKHLEIWSAVQSVRTMVVSQEYPTTIFREMIPLLEQAEKKLLTPDELSRDLYGYYLEDRLQIVSQMDRGSWRSRFFGWYVEDYGSDPVVFLEMMKSINTLERLEMPKIPQNPFHFVIYRDSEREVYLPRIDRMMVNAIQAIHNRQNASAALEAFDRFYQGEMEAAKRTDKPYLKFGATWNAKQKLQGCMVTSITLYGTNSNVGIVQRHLRTKADMHLTRLGAMWRVDPKATLARRGEDCTGRPDHPWYDPYTGRPLLIDTASSPTLIWSVGPNGRDDHANRDSDDIEIHVPRQ